MKFNFTALPHTKGRHGKLFDFAKHPETVFETPLLLLTTKGGSVPHLTREVLDILCRGESHLMQFPLTSTILSHEAIKEFKKGISEFSGLKGHLSYCTTQDPLTTTPTGYNQESLISLWTRTGRKAIDVEKYMDAMEAFQPDIYQVIANSDTNSESSQKKISKTIKSSILLFQQSIERHNESKVLKKAGIVGVVVGGYDIEQRKIHAKFISEAPVDGFSVEGFHNNGPDVEYMDQNKPLSVIEETFKCLPENKFRILHGCWRPEQVLKFVHLGVDIFDSSLPFFLTESFCAFSFKWKRVPLDFEESSSEIEYKICLNNKTFKEDFGPMMENCDCHSCQKHTRAYIYHLIQNKELLASILLMIHNLHHYMEFFKAIRHALQSNEKIVLKSWSNC